MNEALAVPAVGAVALAAACFFLGREVIRTHGFGGRIPLYWVGLGVAMSFFMWAVLPRAGDRPVPPTPLWFMLVLGAFAGAVFGAAWHFGYAPGRRRAWEEEARSGAASPAAELSDPFSPEELGQIRRGARRNASYFVVTSLFVYYILAQGFTNVPEAAYPAIPWMLLGGIVGLLIAWCIPFGPAHSLSLNDPSRRGMPRGAVARLERRGRELLLRLRAPLPVVLVHLPYFVALLALYATRPPARAPAGDGLGVAGNLRGDRPGGHVADRLGHPAAGGLVGAAW